MDAARTATLAGSPASCLPETRHQTCWTKC